MNYLHKLVHHSPIFQAHIGALDNQIGKKMEAAKNERKGVDPPVPDEDLDGSQIDTDLEMNLEQATFPSRIAQQALWLAVPYQQAVEVVTNRRALPRSPVSLTFWGPPVKRTITETESWTDVIDSMYPSTITTDNSRYKHTRYKHISIICMPLVVPRHM